MNAVDNYVRRCRCRHGDMAGVGRDCGHHRPGRRSCLADGLIDVLPRRGSVKRRPRKPCHFVSGVSTGVLCCRRPEKWQRGVSLVTAYYDQIQYESLTATDVEY